MSWTSETSLCPLFLIFLIFLACFLLLCYYYFKFIWEDLSFSMDKLKKLLKKFCTQEVTLYIVFGLLSTCINIFSFMLLTSIFRLEENLASNIGIILSVLFAYFTNRKLVFNSIASTLKEKLSEFGKFMLGRAFTMIVESFGFWFLFTVLSITYFDGILSKLTITIIVIILNFFISKFFAFKK